jgi:hypothetical protein
MSFWRVFFATVLLLTFAAVAHAQISKGNQILIERGFQVQGLVSTYDTFHLSTLSNANYTTVNWLWNDPRSYSGSMPWLGDAPGFPWARWVSDEADMPPLGDESPYLSQLVSLQLGDEPSLDDLTTRNRFVTWINSVRASWPNTLLAVNDGGGLQDGNLIDFVNRGRPDILTFDVYPWKSTYDTNQSDHIGTPIGGPPTIWYSVLRIHRDISGAFGIPFGSYVQTFHAVEEYGPHNVYRDPSPSELRLNHSGALAFNSKMLIDFHYNNGSSSLFTSPGGDSNPNALYSEKADIALRCRNFGKALVRLKPIEEATSQWTTSVLFIRGKNSSGTLNAIPLNFYAGANGANPTTDWVYQRNDPWLTSWTVANKGTKNNGQSGDVILAWFKLLDESFDGADFTNELYLMVVNGLTETNGTAADCAQEIKLNFNNALPAIERMNPLTGQAEVQALPLTNGVLQLVLNLNGGDAALFKFADGAPFVGAPATGLPAIVVQPESRTNAIGSDALFTVVATGAAPLKFQWRFNGTNLPGATTYSYARTNAQPADAGSYTVVVTNSQGSVTSSIATLSIALPPPPPPLLYEPFDYSNVGGPVSANTPGNWISSGTGVDDFNITSGNLFHAGLPASIGNSATNGGAGVAIRRLFGQTLNSGTVYFSVLFNLISYAGWGSGAVTNGAQVCALTSSDNASFRLQVLVKSNTPSTYFIGAQKGGTGSTSIFANTPADLGSTVLLVGKYDFTQTPNPVTLWINPGAGTFGQSEPASGALTISTGTDNLGIDRFNFRQNVLTGSSSVPGFMQWDELRIGTNWASVTPPGEKPQFGTVNLLSGNRLQFQVSADPGILIVEASTNLTNWSEITNLSSSNGVFEYIDPTISQARRFFRVKIR